MKNKKLKEMLSLYDDDVGIYLSDPGSLFVQGLKNNIQYEQLLSFGDSEKEREHEFTKT